MTNSEKVRLAVAHCLRSNDCSICEACPYNEGNDCGCRARLRDDIITLLKTQEPATIEPKRIDLTDETKAWLDKMDAVDALGNIADICMDWDGYRTANGLGRLINEVWAYARYCADRLAKAQEPIEPYTERDGRTTFFLCGGCNKPLCIAKDSYKPKHCPEAGRCGAITLMQGQMTKCGSLKYLLQY